MSSKDQSRRQRVRRMLQMARTSGALANILETKDEAVLPPDLRRLVEARRQDLETTIERILIEEDL